MEQDLILLKKDSLCKELDTALELLLSHINEYLNSFERKDFFALTLTDAQTESYKGKFSLFRSSIADSVEKATESIGKASELLVEADLLMLEDITLKLSELLKKYASLENTLSCFLKESSRSFKENCVSLTQLSEGAKKLRFAAEALRECAK